MADSEEWRRRRAEELAAARAWPGAPATRPAPATPPPAPPRAAAAAKPPPAAQVSASPPPAAPTLDARTWRGIALALALLLALALGWVIRDMLDDRPERAAPATTPGLPGETAATAAPPKAAPLPEAVPPELVLPAAPPPSATAVLPPPPSPVIPPAGVTQGGGRAEVAPRPARPARAALKPSAGATKREARPRKARPPARCRASQAPVYRMICEDPALSAREQRLVGLYRRAMARADAGLARRIDEDHAAFLNRRSRCDDPACVARLTDRRIDRLARFVG